MPAKKSAKSLPASASASPAPAEAVKKPRVTRAKSTAATAAPKRKHKIAAAEPVAVTSESISNLAIAVDAEQVAMRAYEYWQQRGCPAGSPDEDWYRAEQELLARAAGR